MRNKTINTKAVSEHTRRIFAITQQFPPNIVNLLLQRNRRQLNEKEQRQIFDHLRQKNIFPVLVNPKTFSEFCAQIGIELYKKGQSIQPNNNCYVILDGAIKIYQQIIQQVNPTQKQKEPENTTFDLSNKKSDHKGIQHLDSLKLSLANISINQQAQSQKIQKQKIQIGQVLIFEQNRTNLTYIATSSSILLRIPHHIYYTISLTTFMVQFKKKQQFFSKIPLFERHYRSSLQDFVNSLQQVTCGFGKRVFREGQNIQYIYIIKQGEFILQKYVSTDDIIVKQGKVTRVKTQGNQDIFQNQIKNQTKHYRTCPYKIVSQKQILGDSQYLFNNKTYIHSMRCHKQGSKLYFIKSQLYFKKLYVSQNGVERSNKLLQQSFATRKKQIEAGVKFNQSNLLILKFMPNNTLKNIYPHSNPYSKQKQKNSLSIDSPQKSRVRNTTQRSISFFQSLNKTIINKNKGTFRKRSQSKNGETRPQQFNKKVYKTPAVVQQIVHIVNQKKAYHRLRNLGMQKSNAFQFDINNVPPFIKKKYGHILQRNNK